MTSASTPPKPIGKHLPPATINSRPRKASLVAKRLYRAIDVPTGCKPFATPAPPECGWKTLILSRRGQTLLQVSQTVIPAVTGMPGVAFESQPRATPWVCQTNMTCALKGQWNRTPIRKTELVATRNRFTRKKRSGQEENPGSVRDRPH